MKQTYPYYVVAQINAGQMVKIMRGKKFNSYSDCVIAAAKWQLKFPELWRSWQIVILEYTNQYKSKIKTIFTNGECVNVY